MKYKAENTLVHKLKNKLKQTPPHIIYIANLSHASLMKLELT